MTELRIGPGQQSGVRRRGQRNLRIRSRKHHALLGQRIKVGCQATLGAKKPHAIGPRRVEGDQDDVRGRWILRGSSLGGFREGGSAHKVRQKQTKKDPPDKPHRGYGKKSSTRLRQASEAS